MLSRRGIAALCALGLAAAWMSGCSPWRSGAPGSEPTPAEAFKGVLGRNPGLSSLRAEVEARFRYAGGEVQLPGVLVLDRLAGFRLDLLDPLDRPLAIVYAEDGRIVQYRPALRQAASLGLFPEACRGVGAADWVATVLSASAGPVAGERVAVRALWRGERGLERSRDGQLRQSVRFRFEGAEMVPRLSSWYCADEPVLQLRLREWVTAGDWRLPTHLEIGYPAAGLSVSLELRVPEANPPAAGRALIPAFGDDVRWTSWRLPR